TDSIRPGGAKGAYLGRRLVTWPGHRRVDARRQRQPRRLSRLADRLHQPRRIRAGLRKMTPGVGPVPFEMVTDGQKAARPEVAPDAARGVGQQRETHSQFGRQTDGTNDHVPGMSLVIMQPALGHEDAPAGPLAEGHSPAMSLHRGRRKTWNIR